MQENRCKGCGVSFVPSRRAVRYCSQRCRYRAWQSRRPPKTLRELNCKQCGVVFETSDRRKAFCSPNCNVTYQNRQRPTQKAKPRECPLCGTVFLPMQTRGVGKRYCSTKCQNHAKYLRYRAHAGKVKFNLSEGEYDALAAAQRGVCAICEQPETAVGHKRTEPRKLAVDHCHDSGTIRGLLCTKCNQGLGLFAEDPDRLHAAIRYLKKPRSQ